MPGCVHWKWRLQQWRLSQRFPLLCVPVVLLLNLGPCGVNRPLPIIGLFYTSSQLLPPPSSVEGFYRYKESLGRGNCFYLIVYFTFYIKSLTDFTYLTAIWSSFKGISPLCCLGGERWSSTLIPSLSVATPGNNHSPG